MESAARQNLSAAAPAQLAATLAQLVAALRATMPLVQRQLAVADAVLEQRALLTPDDPLLETLRFQHKVVVDVLDGAATTLQLVASFPQMYLRPDMLAQLDAQVRSLHQVGRNLALEAAPFADLIGLAQPGAAAERKQSSAYMQPAALAGYAAARAAPAPYAAPAASMELVDLAPADLAAPQRRIPSAWASPPPPQMKFGSPPAFMPPSSGAYAQTQERAAIPPEFMLPPSAAYVPSPQMPFGGLPAFMPPPSAAYAPPQERIAAAPEFMLPPSAAYAQPPQAARPSLFRAAIRAAPAPTILARAPQPPRTSRRRIPPAWTVPPPPTQPAAASAAAAALPRRHSPLRNPEPASPQPLGREPPMRTRRPRRALAELLVTPPRRLIGSPTLVPASP